MKKINLFCCFLILTSIFYNGVFSQDKKEKSVIITFTWSRIQSHGSNQIAIWIEDTVGRHVTTLFATQFTARGGYAKRPVALSEWSEKFNLKNAKKEEVDAITGPTPKSGEQTFIWNCKDKSGRMVLAGKYIVRMEANVHDADKMFYKGEVIIGGENQLVKGEITYSSSTISSDNALVKNVVVEYK